MQWLRRRRWFIAVLMVLFAGGVIAWLRSGQKIEILNDQAELLQEEQEPAIEKAMGPDRLVLIDLTHSGYAAYIDIAADELSYGGFFPDGDSLILSGDEPHSLPLRVDGEAKLAINRRHCLPGFNAAKYPFLARKMPWPYCAPGAPLLMEGRHHYKARYSLLRHDLVITHISDEGRITIEIGKRHILLEPGGEIKVSRSLGLWSSTISIIHRGVFEKEKVRQSDW